MRKQPVVSILNFVAALVVALTIGPVLSLAQASGATPKSADTATVTPKVPVATKPPAPDISEKLTAQLNTISDKLSALQTDELQTSINTEKAISAAAEKVDNIKDAPDNLYKGKMLKGLPEYRQTLLTAAAQWLALYQKLQPISAQAKILERDRAKATPELQTLIDQLVGRIDEKGRNIQEKVGELYESAGDYKRAVACYTAVLQGIPEAKRSGEKKLFSKIVKLYADMGDARNALLFFKALQPTLPENERYRDGGMGLRICDLLEKVSDFRTEYDLLKAMNEANPGDKGVADRFETVKKKVGVTAGGGIPKAR
jgi:tetratricopeptide (TPR) repeat protein